MNCPSTQPGEINKATATEKLVHLKEALSFDDRQVLIDVLNSARYAAYDAGYQDGLKAYAWWKDGEQYCGTCGTTLGQAIDQRKASFRYRPDHVNILPDQP